MDTKHSGDVSDTLFKVYCPGQYKTFPHKLKMFINGSASNNIRYPEICNIKNFAVNIAYYTQTGFFEVVNNTMVEWYDYWGLIHDMSQIPYDYEILKTFFQIYNIGIINWIDYSGTWGLFNHETGNWSGLVGQVNNYYEYNFTCRGKNM